MKSQERRDGDAVVITTAMLWLAAVTVIVLLLHAGIAHVIGLDDGNLSTALFVALLACAVAAPVRYLYRNRRP